MAHIAVVDDKQIIRDSLREALIREDHRVNPITQKYALVLYSSLID